MGKITAILALVLMMFGSFAPLSSADAFNNIVIDASSGVRVYTPTPSQMSGKKFELTFVIANVDYIDPEDGSIHYFKDYQNVRWRINGCGVNYNVDLNREDHRDQLVGTLPQVTVKGTLPANKECTITTEDYSKGLTTAMLCEPDENDNCRNNDAIYPLPITIDIAKKDDVIKIIGQDVVFTETSPKFRSRFYPMSLRSSNDASLPKVRVIDSSWTWGIYTPNGQICSRETHHNRLNPIYTAIISKKASSKCIVKANAAYLVGSNVPTEKGIRFGLNYINGSKEVLVAQERMVTK